MFDKNLSHNQYSDYYSLSNLLVPIILAILLVILSFYNFILFHTLAELFAVMTAVLMSVVAWHMYPFTKNNFLMFLGTGYFWIGCLDLVHAISYKGLDLLPIANVGTSTQFWIITRFFEAFILVSAPWFLNHRFNREKSFLAFGVTATIFAILILYTDLFPKTFIEGSGLTSFKVISEYVIIAILMVAIFRIWKRKDLLDDRIVNIMIVSIVLTMCAELSFTFYVDLYGLSNIVGHIFKLFSFWLIFMAMVNITLREPFLVMSRAASTYEAIPDATIVVDIQGVIRQANSAANMLAGLQDNSLVGKNNHDLFHPASLGLEECPVCLAILNNEKLDGMELEVAQDKWFDFTLSFISGTTNQLGTVEVIRDITQRKKSENDFKELNILNKSIVDNLPNMLFVKDAIDHSYIEWNKAAEELTGFAKQDMLGKSDFDFWSKEEAQFFIDKDIEVIRSGVLAEIHEEPITTKYKSLRTLYTKKIPIYDEDGKARYLLGMSEDITEKIKIEKMLSRSQKMEAVGQMSGGIAHDFNNQLGVILGYSELLSDQGFSQSELKWIDSIRIAAERCADLTSQLLVFSRNTEIEKEVLNINDIVKEMETIIRRTITPEVKFQYFLNETLWAAEINLGEFKDAVLNLILNARDAMPDGGSLTIETSNITLSQLAAKEFVNIDAGEYVQVMVSDSGCGMSQKVYEHVFEPFFTTKDVGKGTGLGLSMVYGFVSRYGGDISLDTSPGHGAIFRIYLPRALKNTNDEPSDSLTDEDFLRGNESLLVVDDEEILLAFAEEVLNDWGYQVYCATSVNSALKILEETSIDLLFTDVVMPGETNGFELAEIATQKFPGLKVLITSGFAEKIGDIEKYAAHAFEILPKPYARKELADKLRKLLDAE